MVSHNIKCLLVNEYSVKKKFCENTGFGVIFLNFNKITLISVKYFSLFKMTVNNKIIQTSNILCI